MALVTKTDALVGFERWRCSPMLSLEQQRTVHTEMMLNGQKWDPQVGDVCTLAPFGIVLPADVVEGLFTAAEALAGELQCMEDELAGRPDLWARLGVPASVRRMLQGGEPWTPSAARVVRFDFHPTESGWRISEANSDVPGGYTESSHFTALMAQLSGSFRPSGNPAATLVDALAAQAERHGQIALIAAAGYTEDQQVVAHLAALLHRRGIQPLICTPPQIAWKQGRAAVIDGARLRPVDAVFRFYQAEWTARMPELNWMPFFRGGLTPVCNPGTALFGESKRAPVLWSELQTRLPTWRALLPETRTPWLFSPEPKSEWVLKGTYSNTGDVILGRSWTRRRDWYWSWTDAALRPTRWAIQRSFASSPFTTPLGPMHVCLGVYVINGYASGIYGRISPKPRIDFQAIDTAILVDEAVSPYHG